MRKSATLLVASTLAMGLPLAAMADTVTIDGVVYTDGTESVFVTDTYAAPVDGYAEMLEVPAVEAYQMTEETYGVVEYVQDEGPVIDVYEAVEEASYVIEYAQTGTIDTGMSGEIVAMEPAGGIVYETMTDGDITLSAEMPVVQTY